MLFTINVDGSIEEEPECYEGDTCIRVSGLMIDVPGTYSVIFNQETRQLTFEKVRQSCKVLWGSSISKNKDQDSSIPENKNQDSSVPGPEKKEIMCKCDNCSHIRPAFEGDDCPNCKTGCFLGV